ncbi:MAG: hypothetical protein ACRC11_10985 [Xenococcaceae cyanobacterium]
MSNTKIHHPAYLQIVKREPSLWRFYTGKVFYRPEGATLDIRYSELSYDLTKKQITIELFRINGGNLGYYLANLRDRKYYYCGTDWEDVKETLYSLGIGRKDNATT